LQRLDYVAFQLKELEEASPVAGEEASLKTERNRLAHSEKLRQGLSLSVGTLSDDDESALSRIGVARKTVRELAKLDPSLEAYAARLDAAQIELDDLSRSLENHLDEGSGDPRELDRLESRLALLSRLAKKHGCQVDELHACLQRLSEEAHSLSNADEERARLDEALAQRAKALEKIGRELSGMRSKGAEKFAREVSEALRPLAMPKARFFVRVDTAASLSEATASGLDRVQYEIVTNAGEPQRPLGKVASGGELSRISLAIQSVLGEHSDVPTFIFDEVDAGIGGATAEIVADTLASLGIRRQVLCVTHLAQVAARANKHYRVEKSTNAGRTSSVVAELKGKARSEELARMLGGVHITDAVRKHAAELLRARAVQA
jgi:DNA repair protein RecN (Recombination protein N)